MYAIVGKLSVTSHRYIAIQIALNMAIVIVKYINILVINRIGMISEFSELREFRE